MSHHEPRRGLVTSDSVNAADRRRIVEAARRLGVELIDHPAADNAQMAAALDAVPDAELMLADFLPDADSGAAGSGSSYAFGLVAAAADLPADVREAAHRRVRNLRWIQIAAVGVNQEAGSFVWRETPQIQVTTASGLPSVAMAQYIAAAILNHAHGFGRLGRYRDVRNWSVRSEFRTEVLVGRTLGLLGYGGTGRRAAHIAHALGMRVVAVRRSGDGQPPARYRLPAIEAVDRGFEPAEIWGIDQLDRLLGESDYLACTLPLTAETRGLVGARELGLLRPSAVVINVSRGPIFDEAALIDALRNGRLAGAALDVFETEPLPDDSPLWDLPNVLLSPHASGTHDHVSEYTADLFVANLERYVSGRTLLNLADRDRGY
jgi:phosphoglycerate dehydrogenase-like enzyme